MINLIPTAIPGVVIIQPRVFGDARGYFFESYSERDFNQAITPILGHGIKFVQDNESMSTYGVMRGLHFQAPPFTQSKLVRCVQGAVLDVAVDIRKGSPTYGQHVSCLLCGHDAEGQRIAEQYKDLFLPLTRATDGANLPLSRGTEGVPGLQFFVPRGFAHGFSVLSQTAVFQYKCDNYYAPQADGGINILDQSLGINWHLPGYGLPLEKSALNREDLGGSGDQSGSALLSEKDTKHPLLKDFDSPFNIDMDLYPH